MSLTLTYGIELDLCQCQWVCFSVFDDALRVGLRLIPAVDSDGRTYFHTTDVSVARSSFSQYHLIAEHSFLWVELDNLTLTFMIPFI